MLICVQVVQVNIMNPVQVKRKRQQLSIVDKQKICELVKQAKKISSKI
jgi:hypothetical protein